MRTEGQRLLRRYLEDNGLTQRLLSRKVKRSEPTVSLWMSGVNLPDIGSAVALEDATGVPIRAWTRPPRRGNKAAAA